MMKIVKVEWVDSCTSDQNWKPINELNGLAKCVSVGFLVKKTKDYVVLFPNITGEQNILGCCDFTIPSGCIKKIKYLK